MICKYCGTLVSDEMKFCTTVVKKWKEKQAIVLIAGI